MLNAQVADLQAGEGPKNHINIPLIRALIPPMSGSLGLGALGACLMSITACSWWWRVQIFWSPRQSLVCSENLSHVIQEGADEGVELMQS